MLIYMLCMPSAFCTPVAKADDEHEMMISTMSRGSRQSRMTTHLILDTDIVWYSSSSTRDSTVCDESNISIEWMKMNSGSSGAAALQKS